MLVLFLFHKCEPGLRQQYSLCVLIFESRKYEQSRYTLIREQKWSRGSDHFKVFAVSSSQMARGLRRFILSRAYLTLSLLFCSVRSESIYYFNRFQLNPIHFLFKTKVVGKQLTTKDLLKALWKLEANYGIYKWNYNPTKEK